MNVTAAGISNMQQGQLMEKVGMAVAKKTLDAAKQQGAAALSLLDGNLQMAQQTTPSPSASGKGQVVDVLA